MRVKITWMLDIQHYDSKLTLNLVSKLFSMEIFMNRVKICFKNKIKMNLSNL